MCRVIIILALLGLMSAACATSSANRSSLPDMSCDISELSPGPSYPNYEKYRNNAADDSVNNATKRREESWWDKHGPKITRDVIVDSVVDAIILSH